MAIAWPHAVLAYLEQGQCVAHIMILAAKGSTPRGIGVDMLVSAHGQEGTIGGGAMEFQATDIARQAFKNTPQDGFSRFVETFALGPDLGQCCGGHITILCEIFTPSAIKSVHDLCAVTDKMLCHDVTSQDIARPIDRALTSAYFEKETQRYIAPVTTASQSLYVYGAGHVGRALMPLVQGLALSVIWVDTDKSRFPDPVPDDVTIVPAADMAVVARHAPQGAFHVVLTYSHQFDEAICHELLAKGAFGKLGLIGSATKKARFDKRFLQAGISQELIDAYHCPVGLRAIQDKSPAHVALSIAGQIAQWLEESG